MAWTELPDELAVDEPARADRLQRRLQAVLRQLEQRIAEVDGLRAEVALLRVEVDGLRNGVDSLQAELDRVRALDDGANQPDASQPATPPPSVAGPAESVVNGQRLLPVSDLEHRALQAKRWAMARVRRARITPSRESSS